MYSDTDILFTREEKLLKIKDLISDWDYILALRLINELLEQEDNSSNIYYLKGYIYDFRYDEPQKAEEYYRKALALDSENIEALHHYLCLLNKCRRADLVLKQIASKKDTDFRHLHEQIILQKVLALELLGRIDEAKLLVDRLFYSSINDDFINDIELVINRINKKIENKEALLIHKSYYELKII